MNGGRTSGSILLALLTLGGAGSVEGQEMDRIAVLAFDSESVDTWYAVNDGVMGGRSFSQMRHEGGDTAVFEGTLSLENNGGFASVRTEITEGALTGIDALILKVRGDGRRYQLRLRMSRRFDGVAYAATFETRPNQWSIVELPLELFRPTFRGYVPRNPEPLDPGRIQQMGLMLADKQEGRFRLEVARIDALRSLHESLTPASSGEQRLSKGPAN
jgi:monofunctional biosynthetic peptidoglycan transglycosylase